MTEESPSESFIKSTVNTLIAYKYALDNKDEKSCGQHLKIIDENFQKMVKLIIGKEKDPNFSLDELIRSAAKLDFPLAGLSVFSYLPVEQRKTFTHIFNGTIAYSINYAEKDCPVLDYLFKHQNIPDILIHFYDHPELAINAGEMLRAISHHEIISRILLKE